MNKLSVIILLVLLILYGIGFACFTFNALTPSPLKDTHTDATIILTGGENRIKEGVLRLKMKQTEHVFISGVGKDITLKDIYPEGYEEIKCCVSLGYVAQDTIGNATESFTWLSQHKHIKSFALVTSSYHIPRAAHIFKTHPEAKNHTILLVPIPMERLSPKSREFWNLMFKEYNKLIYTWCTFRGQTS